MFLREHPHIAIFCLTAVVASCVAIIAWARRETAPATRPFTGLMMAIAAYATAAAANAATFSLWPSVVWATLEYIASNTVIALYLIFTLQFSGYQRWRQPKRRLLLWLLPVFNMLLVITNHWHHLVWTQWHVPTEAGQLVTASHGIGYFWIAACFYIYVVTGSSLVARVAINASNLYRKQAIVIIASACPPIVAGSLYVLEIVPLGFNILPLSFLFTGLIYFASLFRWRLFDLLPIARDVLIEHISDGVIVLDSQNRVIDLNLAAQRYINLGYHFNGIKHRIKHEIKATVSPFPPVMPLAMPPVIPPVMPTVSAVGQHLNQVLSHWPEIIHCCHAEGAPPVAIIERIHIPCYLEVRVSDLYHSNAQRPGRLVVIRDITEQQQAQRKLQRSNAELQAQLREIQLLRDQLKEQAIRDRLTGLFNRRYFEEAMPAELAKSARSGSPLTMVLLDIDHFKRVNDCYGHPAGDYALGVFAKTVRSHIRKSDIACRYGGEEFVIVFPNLPLNEAYKRADRIRQAFKSTLIEFEEFRFSATVSIGVGAFSGGSQSQADLLRAVDQALYQAKAKGRDRVEIASVKSLSL